MFKNHTYTFFSCLLSCLPPQVIYGIPWGKPMFYKCPTPLIGYTLALSEIIILTSPFPKSKNIGLWQNAPGWCSHFLTGPLWDTTPRWNYASILSVVAASCSYSPVDNSWTEGTSQVQRQYCLKQGLLSQDRSKSPVIRHTNIMYLLIWLIGKGTTITSVVLWPKMHNLKLVMRKHNTNKKWVKYYIISKQYSSKLSTSWKKKLLAFPTVTNWRRLTTHDY